MKETFNRAEAFSRNLGLISTQEQARLFRSTVAIAGCGGVGGMHAHTLARLGIGRFKLTDFDTFSVGNFNRQIGATVHTLGKDKAEVTREMILAINPQAHVELMPGGIDEKRAEAFVAGSDLVVDGIDFFAMKPRLLLFQAARRAKVVVMTAAPLGFSGALLTFMPDGLSFEEYFGIEQGMNDFDAIVNFLLGLAPSGLHGPYIDFSHVDPATGRGPSSVIGSQMAASLVGAEAVRILLKRGGVKAVPWYHQLDAYRHRCVSRYLRGGHRHWLQRLKRRRLVRFLKDLGLDAAFSQRVGSVTSRNTE